MKNLIISGPKGSGKTYLAVHFIVNNKSIKFISADQIDLFFTDEVLKKMPDLSFIIDECGAEDILKGETLAKRMQDPKIIYLTQCNFDHDPIRSILNVVNLK